MCADSPAKTAARAQPHGRCLPSRQLHPLPTRGFEGVRKAFPDGTDARVMQLFEDWEIADERWQLAVESAFARSTLVRTASSETRPFAFTLTPKWAKARWARGALQPAKLYHFMKAGFLD